MSEAKHTPGPWHWTDHISPHISIYAGGGNTPIVQLTEPFYRDSAGVGVANAALITAAPELLAACKAALPLIYLLGAKMDGPKEVVNTFKAMTDAIAKAEQS